MSASEPVKLVLLAILDGWGIAPDGPGNAISLSNKPNMNRFYASFPKSQLLASGESVGLPREEAGNTETGHLNLGSGRIVYQDLMRINMSIAEGSFFENQAFIEAFEHAKKNNSNLHLIGLIGAGGVHSNIEHLFALLNFAKRQGFPRVFLHIITDGRDSPPTAALTYIKNVRKITEKEGVGKIASVMGRYWAMDRDFRWERTAKAYFTLTKGTGICHTSAEEVISDSYNLGRTDEFIEPCSLNGEDGNPIALIKDHDSIIFFNFRIDRPRQLSAAFLIDNLNKTSKPWGIETYRMRHGETTVEEPEPESGGQHAFERGPILKNLYFAMMTDYGKFLTEAGAKVAFPREQLTNTLGQVVSEAGLRQLRVAESEKERFVTYYFNGQRELAYQGEDRLIIPSPKVPTYDQKPEMSAREMTDVLLSRLQDTTPYSFVLVNYANPDMVGHSGNIGATVKACEVVDECLGKLANYVTTFNGVMLVTADHGNAEELINLKTNAVDTEHSNNPVPFLALSKRFIGNNTTLPQGILADIAPTVLSILNLPIPSAMTGRSLLSSIWSK